MAYPVKHDFKPGALALIRGRVINAISRICSFWACGNYINIHKPETPSGDDPIVWDLDVKGAAAAIAHEFHAQDLWKDGEDYPLKLAVTLARNSAGTATGVSTVKIYLPHSGVCRINGDNWTFDTDKFTDNTNGWHMVQGFTTGNLWLVEKASADKVLTFQTTSPASGDMAFFVGSVAFASGAATIRQNLTGGLVYGGISSDNTQRKDMVGTSASFLTAGLSGWGQGKWTASTRDANSWVRGTSTVTVNGKDVKCGVKIMLPTRMINDGLDAKIMFRQFEWDQNGCLKKIGEESATYGSVTTVEDDE